MSAIAHESEQRPTFSDRYLRASLPRHLRDQSAKKNPCTTVAARAGTRARPLRLQWSNRGALARQAALTYPRCVRTTITKAARTSLYTCTSTTLQIRLQRPSTSAATACEAAQRPAADLATRITQVHHCAAAAITAAAADCAQRRAAAQRVACRSNLPRAL